MDEQHSNGTGQIPLPPPVSRKVPPPPPQKRKPNDLISHGEAGRRIGRSNTWIAMRVKDGTLTDHGLGRQVVGGRPPRMVSLKEVMRLSQSWPKRPKKTAQGAVEKPAMTSEAKRMLNARSHKAQGVTTFAREEVRHFASDVMVGLLNASSITITEKSDGTFEIVTTPRVPATQSFTV